MGADDLDPEAFAAARAKVRALFPRRSPGDPVTLEMHQALVAFYEQELKKKEVRRSASRMVACRAIDDGDEAEPYGAVDRKRSAS